MEQALIILTVPAEFSDAAKAIMRDCVFQANLIATKNSEKLQFITECRFIFKYLKQVTFHFFLIIFTIYFNNIADAAGK